MGSSISTPEEKHAEELASQEEQKRSGMLKFYNSWRNPYYCSNPRPYPSFEKTWRSEMNRKFGALSHENLAECYEDTSHWQAEREDDQYYSNQGSAGQIYFLYWVNFL